MSWLGVGEIIGGQIIAYAKDRANSKAAFAINIALTFAAFILLIWYNERNKFDWLANAFVLLWGMQDSGS